MKARQFCANTIRHTGGRWTLGNDAASGSSARAPQPTLGIKDMCLSTL